MENDDAVDRGHRRPPMDRRRGVGSAAAGDAISSDGAAFPRARPRPAAMRRPLQSNLQTVLIPTRCICILNGGACYNVASWHATIESMRLDGRVLKEMIEAKGVRRVHHRQPAHPLPRLPRRRPPATHRRAPRSCPRDTEAMVRYLRVAGRSVQALQVSNNHDGDFSFRCPASAASAPTYSASAAHPPSSAA